MIVKNKKLILCMILLLTTVTGCGKQTETFSEPTSLPQKDEPVKIEDIDWNVTQGIVKNERYMLLNYTNHSDKIITGFEIIFKEKAGITEEQKKGFYKDIKEQFKFSKEDMNDIKNMPIAMHAESKRLTNPGESVKNVNCYYYKGVMYLKNIDHFALVEPDIATIHFVDDDKIKTVSYDYNTKNYTYDEEMKDCFEWSKQGIGDKIPKPDTKVIETLIDQNDNFIFEAQGISTNMYNAYLEECKKMGYKKEPVSSENYYSASDKNGAKLILSYDEEDAAMNVTIMDASKK